MWLVGALAFFVGGLIASEVFVGNATVQDVQPFSTGLAVDEAMFGSLLLGVPIVLLTWYLTRRNRLGRPIAS